MKVIFKDIEEYEALYQISNFGDVKSFPKWDGTHFTKEKILKPQKDKYGYLLVSLYKNKKKKIFKVHRLVLRAFIGKSSLQVNHKDGIKSNNELKNLEYCTPSENIKHAFKIGYMKNHKNPILKGEKNPSSKLKEEQIIFIRQNKYHYRQKEFANMFGVGITTISNIINNRRWRNI